MKGLKQYIRKHGRHLTEELALSVIDCKWNPSKVEQYLKDLVYYNVTKSSLGDMVYLVNRYKIMKKANRQSCIRFALNVVEEVKLEGYAFDEMLYYNKNIDLRKYI